MQVPSNFLADFGTYGYGYDVSALCCTVHDAIHTTSQISAHTKISKTYLQKRIARMRENDVILDGKKISISPDLQEYIRQICAKQK